MVVVMVVVAMFLRGSSQESEALLKELIGEVAADQDDA